MPALPSGKAGVQPRSPGMLPLLCVLWCRGEASGEGPRRPLIGAVPCQGQAEAHHPLPAVPPHAVLSSASQLPSCTSNCRPVPRLRSGSLGRSRVFSRTVPVQDRVEEPLWKRLWSSGAVPREAVLQLSGDTCTLRAPA